MSTIEISTKEILAAHEFAPQKPDIRDYLNGVMVEITPGKDVLLVASDGRVLGVVKSATSADSAMPETKILIKTDVIKTIKASKEKHVTIELPDERPVQQFILRMGQSQITINNQLAIDRYPEWRKFCPNRTLITKELAVFNPHLLARVSDAARILCEIKKNTSIGVMVEYNGVKPAVVIPTAGSENLYAVVMPMRDDYAPERVNYDWVK